MKRFHSALWLLPSYAVIAYGCAECPKLSCGREGCDTEFCYHCRQLWHPNQTCDQARRQRARHTSSGNDSSALYVFNEEPGGGLCFSSDLCNRMKTLFCGLLYKHGSRAASVAEDAEEIKPCPRCGAYIMKTNDGSCNRMNCTVCACQFCWLCMQEITDVHYLRYSGLLAAPGFLAVRKPLTTCGVSQSLRMYLLGQEAMVANPQGSVAGGHVARSTGGHLPHSGPRHPGNHCGDPDLHGSQGSRQSAHPRVPPSDALRRLSVGVSVVHPAGPWSL